MKKLIGAAVAALLVSTAIPAGAAKPKPQVVEGSIVLPAIFATGLGADGCWAGATRRLTQTAAGQGSGIIGYRFPVDKATWNGKFVLEATGGAGTVDFDLFMYSFMPGPEAQIDDPQNGGTPISVDFQTREAGGESGIIPKGTTDAIVCLYGGVAGYAGLNATFKYTGTPPVKKKKG